MYLCAGQRWRYPGRIVIRVWMVVLALGGACKSAPPRYEPVSIAGAMACGGLPVTRRSAQGSYRVAAPHIYANRGTVLTAPSNPGVAGALDCHLVSGARRIHGRLHRCLEQSSGAGMARCLGLGGMELWSRGHLHGGTACANPSDELRRIETNKKRDDFPWFENWKIAQLRRLSGFGFRRTLLEVSALRPRGAY